MKLCAVCRSHTGTDLTTHLCWKKCKMEISLVDGKACTSDIPLECSWHRSGAYKENWCGPDGFFWEGKQ
jgi:hypothetical protein